MPNLTAAYQPVATDSPSKVIAAVKEVLIMPPTYTRQRKWEIFPGRNKFYCNGRIMMAHQSGFFYVNICIIVVTCGLYMGFDAPYLWKNVNPILPILAAFQFIFVLSTLCRTTCSDPGIIPRATPEEAAYIEQLIAAENPPTDQTFRAPARTKDVTVKGQVFKLKYCYTCKIFRPPRASHCSICDNCVERFDHHCPFVGNCIGARNYKFFYLYLASVAFLCIYIFACVVTHFVLVSKQSDFVSALKKSPGSVIVIITAVISFITVIGLCGFHSWLIFTNQTTNEDIKGSFSARRGEPAFNPFSYGGPFSNCMGILCGPEIPSVLDLRGLVVGAPTSPVPHQNTITPSTGPGTTYPHTPRGPATPINNQVIGGPGHSNNQSTNSRDNGSNYKGRNPETGSLAKEHHYASHGDNGSVTASKGPSRVTSIDAISVHQVNSGDRQEYRSHPQSQGSRGRGGVGETVNGKPYITNLLPGEQYSVIEMSRFV